MLYIGEHTVPLLTHANTGAPTVQRPLQLTAGRRRCAERTPGFCAAPLLAPSLTPLWSARHLGEERHARARAARFDVLAHEWRHLEPLDARERAQNRQHEAVVD